MNAENLDPQPDEQPGDKQPGKELVIMPSPAATPHRASIFLTVLALLLAVLACAAVAWLGWKGKQFEGTIVGGQEMIRSWQQQQQGDQMTAQRQYSDLNGKLQEVSSRLWQQDSDIDTELARIDQVLRGYNSKLATLSASDRTDWQLAEVEYLLKLANQRLLMAKEVQGAIALLVAADQILLELDEMALHPARRAVAADLAALRAVPVIDVQGVYLKLEALAQQVSELPMYEIPEMKGQLGKISQDDGDSALVTADSTPTNWLTKLQSAWHASWRTLQKYIVIQHRDQVVQPLPSEQIQKVIRQRLQALIEEAQLALLKDQQTIYADSLNSAITLLQEHYAFNRVSTMAAITGLQELGQLQLATNLPDISDSLRELKTYIETSHQSTPSATSTKAQVTPAATSPVQNPSASQMPAPAATNENTSTEATVPKADQNESTVPAASEEKPAATESVSPADKQEASPERESPATEPAAESDADQSDAPTVTEENNSATSGVTKS